MNIFASLLSYNIIIKTHTCCNNTLSFVKIQIIGLIKILQRENLKRVSYNPSSTRKSIIEKYSVQSESSTRIRLHHPTGQWKCIILHKKIRHLDVGTRKSKKPSRKFKVLLYIPFPISDLMKMSPSLSLPYINLLM